MNTRRLGGTALEVTRLGFGGARIGFEEVPERQVEALLNKVLDLGITFIDTAECYEDSEEMIGRFIGRRRDEYVLATKCGHVVGGARGKEWSARVIGESIDRSLKRLATDRLDLVLLHSCSAEVLTSGEAVEALTKARDAGKTRYVGYSGDGEDAVQAIRLGVFDALEVSFNLVEQKPLQDVLPAAQKAGLGVIAKRPIANAALGKSASPYGYAKPYWERTQQLRMPEGAPKNPMEFSLRFTFSHDVIDTAIVGTTDPEHARQNIEMAEAGPLPARVLNALHEQFQKLGQTWLPQT